MRLQLYDPQPSRHEYISRMYFDPMRAYARERGIELQGAAKLVPTAGYGMICDADYLTPSVVRHFRENDCELFGFSCIDSAFLPEVLRYSPEMPLVNRIFMVSGIQRTNHSEATVVDNDFSIRAERRQFLPEEAWENFQYMASRGAIQSLPYPSWDWHEPPPRKPWGEKRHTVLFRGGAHFGRVIAFMAALEAGVADPWSGFNLQPYFSDAMAPQFRYCDECRSIWQENNRSYPLPSDEERRDCNSPAVWGGELDLTHPGSWNNRCPKSWFWLAKRFQEKHGAIDMRLLAAAMNHENQRDVDHLAVIRDCRFYADAKWEFTINIAQRFWEAASVGTVNLMPRRTADQDYFPQLVEGEHYLTFANDLSDIGEVVRSVSHEQLDRIATNCFALWERWLKPGRYKLNENLLEHIFRLIHTPRNT